MSEPDQAKSDQTKEPKRTYKTQALGASVSKLTRKAFEKRGFADGQILDHWPTIVGEMIGSASHPDRITYPVGKGADGILHLRVGNAGMALDIQHMEPFILERINAHFGYKAIARLKLTQAPLPPKPEKHDYTPRPLSPSESQHLDSLLERIDDPELKKALENLGRSVTGRNKA